MTQEEMWQELVGNGAVWRYPNDPRSPHPVLRSGKHSSGFIDTLAYLSVVRNMKSAGRLLAGALMPHMNIKRDRVDWVVGSPMAGIQLAATVGMALDAHRIGFTEKVKGKDDELECRFDMEPGSRVLQIDEMTTTGETPQRSIDAVLAKNPGVHIIPFAGAIIARESREKVAENLTSARLVSLVNTTEIETGMEEWEAGDCPLCREGSLILKNTKRVWWDLLRNMHDPSYVIPNAVYV
jgi:orotate phosphoribosyltransferase